MKYPAAIFIAAIIFSASVANAQDPAKVASNVYHKTILDNADVRVMEIEFEKGEAAATHSHPKHMAYITQGGQLTITGADGKPSVLDAKAGDIFWMDPQTHSAVNTGETVIKAVVIELKNK